MAVVIDDHLLLNLIADTASPLARQAVAGEAVYTTCCWYYRLARAVLAGGVTGSLSSQLEHLGDQGRDATLASIRRLPNEVGLLGFRTVVPVMATWSVRRPLNMLNAEALGGCPGGGRVGPASRRRARPRSQLPRAGLSQKVEAP